MHRSKDHSRRGLARMMRPAALIALLCVMALPVAAFASSSRTKDASTSDPVGSPAQVQSLLDNAFGPGTVKIGQLQTVAQQAFKIAARPPTAAETKIVENCLKVSPCQLGHPNGTIKLAELEDVNNPYFQTYRAVVALAAEREPNVKELYFENANFSVSQALANFRSAISEGVNVIVGSFDLGSVMEPVVQQAAAKGITVEAATQTIPNAKYNGTDLAGDVVANLCNYGKELVNTAMKSGKTVALFTGTAGNAYGAQWEPCAKTQAAADHASVVEWGNTDWTPQGEQQAASALAAKGLPKSIVYDYTDEAFMSKFLSLGDTPPTMVGGSDDMAAYKDWKSAQGTKHAFTAYEAPSEVAYGYVQVHAAVAKHLGASVPIHLIMPQPMVNLDKIGKYYSASYPAGANFGTGLPANILQAAFGK